MYLRIYDLCICKYLGQVDVGGVDEEAGEDVDVDEQAALYCIRMYLYTWMLDQAPCMYIYGC